MSKNIKLALLIASIAVVVAVGFTFKIISMKQSTELLEVRMFPGTRDIAVFELKDESSKPYTNNSLKGQWSLLFFGYTHCPDVCPTTMSNLAQLVEMLPANMQNKLQVVLVSVDPERDTLEHLKAYVEHFNVNFRGVTGSHKQIKPFAKSLGAIYFKGEVDASGNYPIDHSSKVFLVNPLGQRAGLFDGQAMPPAKSYPLESLKQDFINILKHY